MDYSKVGIIQQNHFSSRLAVFVIESLNDGGRKPLIVLVKHVFYQFLFFVVEHIVTSTPIQFCSPSVCTHFFIGISLIKDWDDKTAMYLIIQVIEEKKRSFWNLEATPQQNSICYNDRFPRSISNLSAREFAYSLQLCNYSWGVFCVLSDYRRHFNQL